MINEQLKHDVKTELTVGLLYFKIPSHNNLIILVSSQLARELDVTPRHIPATENIQTDLIYGPKSISLLHIRPSCMLSCGQGEWCFKWYFLPTYQQILQRKVGRIQTSRQTPDSPLRRWLQNYINSRLCKGVNKKEAAICATVVMVWTTYITWSNDWPQTFDRFEQGMVSVQFSFLLLTWSGSEVAGISEVQSKICRNVQAQEHIEDNILLILY